MIFSDNLAFLGARCARDGWPIGLTSRPETSAPATQHRPPLGDSATAPPASGESGPASALPAPPGRAGISIGILPSKTIRFQKKRFYPLRAKAGKRFSRLLRRERAHPLPGHIP